MTSTINTRTWTVMTLGILLFLMLGWPAPATAADDDQDSCVLCDVGDDFDSREFRESRVPPLPVNTDDFWT